MLGLDCNTHDGRDGVSHNTDGVGLITICDGTLLHDVLVDTDEGDGVTARDIGNGLNLTAHHDDGSLDGSVLEVSLGAWDVVGSHDSDLLASGNNTGEDTTEGVESTSVVGGDKLGEEDHKGSLLVAVLDGLTANIVNGTLVEVTSSVLLGLDGGGELQDDHLKEAITGVDPLLEDLSHLVLALEFLLVGLESDLEGLEHLINSLVVALHAVSAETDDGLSDELDEASLEGGAIFGNILSSPLLGLGIEEVVSPKLGHHLVGVNLELGSINSGEVGKREGPAEEGGTEGDGTLDGVNLLRVTHIIGLVGGDDNVGVLDDTLELLIHVLTLDLELEDTSVNLVDEEDGLDFLTEGLTEYGLSLDTDTLDVIDDDESTIGNSQGGSDLR